MSRSDASIPYPSGRTLSVSYGATAARTASGVGDQVRQVAIYASTDAYYLYGDATVVATATEGTFIPAGQQHFVKIRGGQYVSAIRDTEDGVLKVSELAY